MSDCDEVSDGLSPAATRQITQVRGSNAEAFEALFRAHEPLVHGVCLGVTGTPDARWPFLVHAGGATTEVLGTEIGGKCLFQFSGSRRRRGQSSLSSERCLDAGGGQSGERRRRGNVMLTCRQTTQPIEGERHVVREVDLAPHQAWLSGELAFEGATIDEVARRLECQYDIDIRLDRPAARGQLTARFSEDQPLDAVLTVVVAVINPESKRERNAVTFSASD